MFLIVRVFCCVFAVGFSLYLFIAHQNSLTELRREIPLMAKKVKILSEEKQRLEFRVKQFESPISLLELARRPAYSSLYYPVVNEVAIVRNGNPISEINP